MRSFSCWQRYKIRISPLSCLHDIRVEEGSCRHGSFKLRRFNTSHMFLLGFAYYKLEHRIQRLNFYVCTAALLVVGAAASTRTGLLLCNMLFDTSYALIVVAGITIIAFHSKVLDYLGKISYELYLVQAIPLFALLGSDLPPALIGLICITTDVVLASILHKVTQKLHHS